MEDENRREESFMQKAVRKSYENEDKPIVSRIDESLSRIGKNVEDNLNATFRY